MAHTGTGVYTISQYSTVFGRDFAKTMDGEFSCSIIYVVGRSVNFALKLNSLIV